MHNEAKPIFYFGYLGEKEGAIQCACGRECHLLVLMASAHTATINILLKHIEINPT